MEGIQLVLSGFKGAMDISVYSGEDTDYLYVYLGLALLERVPKDPEQFLYQLMIARLVNSGARLRLLAATFHHSPKTMKAWALAVLSGDVDAIVKAFSGRGPQPRMTAEIRSFAKGRYLAIRDFCPDYRKRIREAILKKYDEDFSDGYLSRLFAEFAAEEAAEAPLSEAPFVDSEECLDEPNRSQDDEVSGSESAGAVTYSSASADEVLMEPDVSPQAPRMPLSDVRITNEPMLVHHAGQIIFSPWIDLVGHDRPAEVKMHDQWLGQILQGAVNVEQSKKLAGNDLALFVGPVRPNHDAQRCELGVQAASDTFLDILSRNGRLASLGDPSLGAVFYYDPHGKEYTGAAKILKGWCGSTHSVGKMLYMDIVHTREGEPCFIYHADNYYDMRERFFLMLHLFRSRFPALHPRTWIIDRGIFGLATFRQFRACGDHLVTWEKGYAGGGWDERSSFKEFRRCRERNNRSDLLVWQFQCQEQPWSKDPQIRRIIVRATNPKGNTVELAILCSNPNMPAEEVVTLIFNRWIQENDFGYLDRHCGLCEITSYATESYAKIETTLRDRDVACPEFSQLKKERRSVEAGLRRELLHRERKTDQLTALQTALSGLLQRKEKLIKKAEQLLARVEPAASTSQKLLDRTAKTIEEAKEIHRQLKKIQRQIASREATLAKLQLKISDLKEQDRELDKKIETVLRDESRLKLLVMENYRRLDTRRKAIMDALKITGRNIFYAAMKLFRPIYNNYRDDHEILRLVSRSPGLIQFNKNRGRIEIRLWLEGTLQKATLHKIRTFLQLISEGINRHFHKRATPVHIDILDGREWIQGAPVPHHTP